MKWSADLSKKDVGAPLARRFASTDLVNRTQAALMLQHERRLRAGACWRFGIITRGGYGTDACLAGRGLRRSV